MVFQILAKTKWREIEIGYLGAILKRYKILKWELRFLMVHTYMVQISLQNSNGKVVFLEGVSWKPPSLGHQREYHGHLGVKVG